MAGTQTAGYDMVIQFSEDFYENIIGSNFEMNQIIPQLLDGFGLSEDRFNLTVTLDRPTDITLPSGSENPIDISIGIGEDGSAANLRIVAGIVVDRTDSGKDILTIDFENNLYHAIATLPIIGDTDISNLFQEKVSPIPIMPIPVTRNSLDPKVVKRVDFKIIDDVSIENENVLSTMLTFGGGNVGQSNQLDSFVDDSGAMGVFFGWLCRLILPKLEESLDIPTGSFTTTSTKCSYNGSVLIDDDEDIYLKNISLELVNGYIKLDARVSKDGFCYEATGDVSAEIKFIIEDGRLKVVAEIGDPDIDLDIPWYCVVVAGIAGIISGGLVFGIVGAVVGGILIPLITWIVAEMLEGTFDNIADSLRDSINGNLPEVDVEAFGIEILFQDVFIDDVILKTKAIVHEAFPVCSAGVVRLNLGQGIDLDKGIVNRAKNSSNDIDWMREDLTKYLETGCQAAIADINIDNMDEVMHFHLSGYNYKTQQKIIQTEFGHVSGGSWFNPYYHFIENKKVLAVKTNEGRYSLIQIVRVEEDYIMGSENEFLAKSGDWIELRYKTFEAATPHVEILGGFSCSRGLNVLKEISVGFIAETNLALGSPLISSNIDNLHFRRAVETRVEERLTNKKIVKLKPAYKGDWIVKFESEGDITANLRAVSTGTTGIPQYLWTIGGQTLKDDSKGIVDINGVSLAYEVKSEKLTLSVSGNAEIEVLIQVNVIDRHGCSVGTARCIKHDGSCAVTRRYIPTFKEYKLLNIQPQTIIDKKFILRKK